MRRFAHWFFVARRGPRGGSFLKRPISVARETHHSVASPLLKKKKIILHLGKRRRTVGYNNSSLILTRAPSSSYSMDRASGEGLGGHRASKKNDKEKKKK